MALLEVREASGGEDEIIEIFVMFAVFCGDTSLDRRGQFG